MKLDIGTAIAIFLLIVLLYGIIGALVDIFVFKLDKYNEDDLKFKQWIDTYKKINPKKKG